MSICLSGGALRSIFPAGTMMNINKAIMRTWITRLVTMLRLDGASDVLILILSVSMDVTKQAPQLVAINSIFKSSTRDFARSTMRKTPS